MKLIFVKEGLHGHFLVKICELRNRFYIRFNHNSKLRDNKFEKHTFCYHEYCVPQIYEYSISMESFKTLSKMVNMITFFWKKWLHHPSI